MLPCTVTIALYIPTSVGSTSVASLLSYFVPLNFINFFVIVKSLDAINSLPSNTGLTFFTSASYSNFLIVFKSNISEFSPSTVPNATTSISSAVIVFGIILYFTSFDMLPEYSFIPSTVTLILYIPASEGTSSE